MDDKEQEFIEMPTMTFHKVDTKKSQRLPIIIGGVIVSLASLMIIVAMFLMQ